MTESTRRNTRQDPSQRIVQRVFVAILLVGIAIGIAITQTANTESFSIQDNAKLFQHEDHANARNTLEAYLTFMSTEFDIEMHVYTTRSSDDINLFANQLFHERNIGQGSQSGRGLLLVVNPHINRVRLEVSTSLESIFTDAFVVFIEQHQMVPFFRSNQVAEGIVATLELLVSQLQKEKEQANIGNPAPLSGSSGGGAVVNANIGEKEVLRSDASMLPQVQRMLESYTTASTPMEVFSLHLALARQRVYYWKLPFNTLATRIYMSSLPTPAQIDNVVHTLARCGPITQWIDPTGNFAVLRYPAYKRKCPPHFLMREEGKWRLDFLAMSYGLRMDLSNYWYIAGSLAENPFVQPYFFAFPDWGTDEKGYFFFQRWHFAHDKDQRCESGFRITSVIEGMPAARLGLEVGDQPFEFNEERVSDTCHFMHLMHTVKPDTPVRLSVMRNNTPVVVQGLAPPYPGYMPAVKGKNLPDVVTAWRRHVANACTSHCFIISE